MAPAVTILSIDGGGLKGLIALKVLREVEMILNKPVVSAFDVIGGTSTGGLIAAALTTGDERKRALYDIDHIENIYTEVGMEVFKQGGVSASGVELARLRKLLDDTFGDRRLTDTVKPVFIPTYDSGQNKIIVFKTRSGLADDSKNVKLTDACLATSAIPPFFPPHAVKYHGRTVLCEDAGFHLKNPAISALAEVVKHQAFYAGRKIEEEEEVALLSVSTGSHTSGGEDFSTDIRQVIRAHSSDMKYVKSQQLEIDFEKVRYLRIDLQLGTGGFSLFKLMTWMTQIRRLGENAAFRNAVEKVMG